MRLVAELLGSSYLGRAPTHYLHCRGPPVVRGLCYPVWSVLEYLASGMTEAEIFANLEAEDLRACQAYAAFIVQKVSQALDGASTRRLLPKQQLVAHLRDRF